MEIDDIIELENNKNYLLLLESILDDCKYFLAVGLDESDEPTNEYVVLKEIIENDETYVSQINNPIILNQLISDFQEDYDDEYNN